MSKKTLAIIANILVILLEALGFRISIANQGRTMFAYYTQLSNLVTVISCALFLALGDREISRKLRMLSSCMLAMTFLITVFVLIPMGAGVKHMLFSGSGIYHHLLCPVLSIGSYIVLEQHDTGKSAIMIPAAVTLAYGIIMLIMNELRLFDGPYPFFRVHQQSVVATVIWMVVLMLIITGISAGIRWAAKKAEKQSIRK